MSNDEAPQSSSKKQRTSDELVVSQNGADNKQVILRKVNL